MNFLGNVTYLASLSLSFITSFNYEGLFSRFGRRTGGWVANQRRQFESSINVILLLHGWVSRVMLSASLKPTSHIDFLIDIISFFLSINISPSCECWLNELFLLSALFSSLLPPQSVGDEGAAPSRADGMKIFSQFNERQLKHNCVAFNNGRDVKSEIPSRLTNSEMSFKTRVCAFAIISFLLLFQSTQTEL
jgi:hypothetical protein